jgi:hypothetical protein
MANTTQTELNWTELGRALRASAEDAHGADDLPGVLSAYQFLLDNPELFSEDGERESWPADMPIFPPADLIDGYYEKEHSS